MENEEMGQSCVEAGPLLVLASSSPYRRRLLSRLKRPFHHAAPEVDETALVGEPPVALVQRLARAKAEALAARFPAHLIIGADQVAAVAGQILGKPLDLPRAQGQLRLASGQAVTFHNGICLLDSRDGRVWVECIPFTVHFRALSEDDIQTYLELEQPFDCAGSFRSEGLGISLFTHTEGDDPTAIEGLPLIHLVTLLHKAGYAVLQRPTG
jgi:MAF protein